MTNVSQNIKEGIEGKPVDWYADVFETLFPSIDSKRANTLWKDSLKKSGKADKKSKKQKQEEEEEDSDDD